MIKEITFEKAAQMVTEDKEVLVLMRLEDGGYHVEDFAEMFEGVVLLADIDDEPAPVAVKEPEKAQEPVAQSVPEKKTRNRSKLDMPKVWALREAGWTLTRIGEEFGVSPQTIANNLNKYNKEESYAYETARDVESLEEEGYYGEEEQDY